MKNSKTPIKLGLLGLALLLAMPTNIKVSEATENQMGEITAPSTADQAPQPSDEQGKKDLIDPEDVKTDPEEEQDPEQETPAPTISPNTSVLRVSNPAPAPETKVKNTNYISQAYIKPNVTKEKLKEVKNDDSSKSYTLSFSIGLAEEGIEKPYQVYIFALKNSQVKNLSLVNTVIDEKATLANDNKFEEIENDEIKGLKLDFKFERNASITGQITINEDDQPGDYSLYYLIEREGQKQVGKIETSLTKTADKTFAESDDKENLNLINPFDNLPFTKYVMNDNIGDRKLTGYFNFSYGDYNRYKFTLTYIDPITKEIKNENFDKPEDIIIKAQSIAKIDIREKGDLISANEVKKDDPKAATDRTANPSPISLGDLMAGKVARTADQSASKEDIVKNLQTATRTLEGMVATNGKSVVEADQNLSQQEADQLADQLNKQDEIIRGLIEQALLNNELDELAKLEKTKAQEEYKKIAALVKDAQNASAKAENKLVELGEYTPDKKDSFDLKGNDLISITKGTARLNITKLPSMTEVKDLTSHYDEVKDFSKNLEKKLDEAKKKVEKVETVTIGKETATKDKKEEKGGSKSKGEIKNSYPIFVRFLENLNKKSKTK